MTEVWTVDKLRALARVKDLAPNSANRKKVNSLSVHLLERGVVEKKYDPANPSHVKKFDKEIAVLTRLDGCKNVPRLYGVDQASKTFWIEYVGKPQRLDAALQQRVGKALRGLAKCHGVFRVKGGKKRMEYKYLFPGNVCVDTAGNVKLIDFGSDLWQIGTPQRQHTPKLLKSPIQK